jgi:hypothetical protein
MRSSSPALFGVFAALSLSVLGCSPDQIAPPASERGPSGESILTSFDRVTLAPQQLASFKAAVVRSGALSSAGLTTVVRNPSVASLTGANGRAQVQGLAAGRTWVVVQSAAAVDSVEVVVQ